MFAQVTAARPAKSEAPCSVCVLAMQDIIDTPSDPNQSRGESHMCAMLSPQGHVSVHSLQQGLQRKTFSWVSIGFLPYCGSVIEAHPAISEAECCSADVPLLWLQGLRACFDPSGSIRGPRMWVVASGKSMVAVGENLREVPDFRSDLQGVSVCFEHII